MEFENERVLKLIFPNDVPSNLHDNPELLSYLYKLGTYKIDQLKKVESKLAEENKAIVEHTQDLAISNYKTFIQTSECSREIFHEFKNTEQNLDGLLSRLPVFTEKCEQFINTSSNINTARRLNSLTLKKNAQLLEILELPQLMDTCIREGKYEEALELAAYVQRMGNKHGNIRVINNIVEAIENSWHTMLQQLLIQLKSDLQLPKCLQVVGYLRRMQAFTTPELKLKFLQARDNWLNNILANIPADDPHQHLTKTIEVTRINLFNIITQFKATFTDDDVTSPGNDIPNNSSNGGILDSNNIFHSWLHEKIENFLKTLETDLKQGCNSLDTILGQCMYFGLSFSRVGADFRALMIPIFVRVILLNFQNSMFKIQRQFENDLENYTLINKTTPNIHHHHHHHQQQQQHRSRSTDDQSDSLSPPDSLLDYPPIASYCNGILSAFNDLMICSPLALANDITNSVQISLEMVASNILSFYRQEQQAFIGNERDNFVRFCSCFAYDLIPYLQRCIHSIFPVNLLTNHLGINLMQLQKVGLTYLKPKQILELLEHLLPDKVDAIIMQKSINGNNGNNSSTIDKNITTH